MTEPGYGPYQHHPGERWNVNMPAIVGVVFAAFLGVVVWVIASNADGSSTGAVTSTSNPQLVIGGNATTVAIPLVTSVQPMPSSTILESTTTEPSTTIPETTIPATTTIALTVPPTAAPAAPADAVPGDLGVAGHAMQKPDCDGGFITILASAIGDEATATGIGAVIAKYPGSNYLRTDQTCPSLTQSVNGEPIYVVYLGPFAVDSDACAARSQGPQGAYARQLSNELGPDHSVKCG